MVTYGYDKQRFPNLSVDSFDCIICSCVSRDPKECGSCGHLFCSTCIEDWFKKNKSCPNRCVSQIKPVVSKALLKMYNDLEIQCTYYDKCNKIIKLIDLQKHEQVCQKARCWNYSLCDGYEIRKDNGVGSCSEVCTIMHTIIGLKGDQKAIYQTLLKLQLDSHQGTSVKRNPSITEPHTKSSSSGFKWDTAKIGNGIEVTEDGSRIYLKEQPYVFRTAIGNTAFHSGVHYWEIEADHRTENELKIGVATSREFDFNSAFCDHPVGYAYYGLGQLRQNSNASGPQYGKKFKKEGVLGVYLNMNEGVIKFSLNGENMGVAFKNEALTRGPLYPAVALLHCAGCKLRTGLTVPSNLL